VQEYRPDSPTLADIATGWKSAYIHVPFCRRRCPYCDFAIVDESVDGSLDHDSYVQALITEIEMEPDFGPLDAVNFGGGTPSRLAPAQLRLVIDALDQRFGMSGGAEISLEVNPEDWNETFGAGLASAGFTRVSIGAQSFDGTVLSSLGRLHTPDMIREAVQGARDSGIRSVGIDLIFGHPTESNESWHRTVRSAMDVDVDHISTYSLTVEPGTEMAREISAGAPAPDDDIQADRYGLFETLATEIGFVRYEISNHARPGHVCRYNLATWSHAEYVAFGIGAHDHRWGERSRNYARADRYMEAVAAGERPTSSSECLADVEQERDRLMLGLRLAAGTPMTPFGEAFVSSDTGRRLMRSGVLEVRNGRLCVTQPMLTDTVVREALSISSRDR